MSHERPKKVLILRLSSLGDVVLASSVLEARFLDEAEVNWLVLSHFKSVLQGHPKISKLHTFDRALGLSGWVALCRGFFNEDFDDVIDLHGSLRTRIMRWLFVFWKLRSSIRGQGQRLPRWRRLPKQRWRFVGYFIFKRCWPKLLRPKPWLQGFSKLVDSPSVLQPKLNYLASSSLETSNDQASVTQWFGQIQNALGSRKIVAIMPSSAWKTKQWPENCWQDFLKMSSKEYFPVVLGTSKDELSRKLVEFLVRERLDHYGCVGSQSLQDTVTVLKKCQYFIGCDTGLFHVSTALGIPSAVILGPTTEDCGYPPWGSKSIAISKKLWCRPCGKNGSRCVQLFQKQKCLTHLSPVEVMEQFKNFVSTTL